MAKAPLKITRPAARWTPLGDYLEQKIAEKLAPFESLDALQSPMGLAETLATRNLARRKIPAEVHRWLCLELDAGRLRYRYRDKEGRLRQDPLPDFWPRAEIEKSSTTLWPLRSMRDRWREASMRLNSPHLLSWSTTIPELKIFGVEVLVPTPREEPAESPKPAEATKGPSSEEATEKLQGKEWIRQAYSRKATELRPLTITKAAHRLAEESKTAADCAKQDLSVSYIRNKLRELKIWPKKPRRNLP